MTWQDTPYTIPLALAAAVSAMLALRTWRHLRAPGSGAAALLLLASAEWMFTYALELAGSDLATKLFWAKLQYPGIVTAPVAWLLFALRYTGRDRSLTRRWLAPLAAVPTVTLFLVLTNDSHGLIWSTVLLDTEGSFSVLINIHGPGFWVHALYAYGCLLMGTLLLLQTLVRSWEAYRWQATSLLISALIPWLGNALYLSKLNPFPGIDPTPLAFTIASVTLVLGMSRLRLGDIMSVSRGAIIDSIDDPIVVLDDRDYILFLNPAARGLLDEAAPTAVGRPVREIWPQFPGHAGHGEKAPQVATEMVIAMADTQRSYDVRISRLSDWRGRLLSRVVVMRDVTERKRLEDQLVRAQRLEAAKRVASRVADDFNNLLGPLVAYPELIKMELAPDDPAVPMCDAMLDAAQEMARISGDMLALGMRGIGDQEILQLNGLAGEVVANVRGAPATLKLEFHPALDLLPVEGSPTHLSRMLSNLISNAREAVGDDGILTVRTENVHLERAIGEYSRVEPGDYVKLTVSDTGRGIPLETRSRMLDPFFTTKTATRKRGSGLGLSLVKAIVDDHRGYLDMESEGGRGTVFAIYLPVWRNPGG